MLKQLWQVAKFMYVERALGPFEVETGNHTLIIFSSAPYFKPPVETPLPPLTPEQIAAKESFWNKYPSNYVDASNFERGGLPALNQSYRDAAEEPKSMFTPLNTKSTADLLRDFPQTKIDAAAVEEFAERHRQEFEV